MVCSAAAAITSAPPVLLINALLVTGLGLAPRDCACAEVQEMTIIATKKILAFTMSILSGRVEQDKAESAVTIRLFWKELRFTSISGNGVCLPRNGEPH